MSSPYALLDPTDAHRALEALIGRWQGEETMHPSPWDPKGGSAIGMIHNARSLDGFAVVQEYQQVREDIASFFGHGVFRYDAQKSQYELHWFDSFGGAPSLFIGTFEHGLLVLQQATQGGFMRTSWDLRQAGIIRYKAEVSGDAIAWQPFMEGVYERV